MSTSSSNSDSSSAKDIFPQLLNQALSSVFESVKDKVAVNVQENGEEYLQQAVEKIKESANKVVTWAKENPVKTAVALAALAAVSTFLVHTVNRSGDAAASPAETAPRKAKKSSTAKSNR